MEPARTIISRLGGNSKVAKICGVKRSTAWKWGQPKEKGGTGGIIPKDHASDIIEAGRRIGFDIPLSAFVPGTDPEPIQMKERKGKPSPSPT